MLEAGRKVLIRYNHRKKLDEGKMPHLNVRRPSEVPARSRLSRIALEEQKLYEAFIAEVMDNVGALSLSPGESVRSVKVRLRRAGKRLNITLDIWDVDETVYFQVQAHQ